VSTANSVKTSRKVAEFAVYDAAMKVKGAKRHIVTRHYVCLSILASSSAHCLTFEIRMGPSMSLKAIRLSAPVVPGQCSPTGDYAGDKPQERRSSRHGSSTLWISVKRLRIPPRLIRTLARRRLGRRARLFACWAACRRRSLQSTAENCPFASQSTAGVDLHPPMPHTQTEILIDLKTLKFAGSKGRGAFRWKYSGYRSGGVGGDEVLLHGVER